MTVGMGEMNLWRFLPHRHHWKPRAILLEKRGTLKTPPLVELVDMQDAPAGELVHPIRQCRRCYCLNGDDMALVDEVLGMGE